MGAPSLDQCVTGLRGPGAHSVGQGLTVTTAPASDPHFPSVSLIHGGRAPTVSAKCELSRLCLPPDCVALLPRRAAGPGAHSVGQGLTVTAAPCSNAYLRTAFSECVTGLRGPGAHSVGPVGQGLTVTAVPTSGQWLTLFLPG